MQACDYARLIADLPRGDELYHQGRQPLLRNTQNGRASFISCLITAERGGNYLFMRRAPDADREKSFIQQFKSIIILGGIT